MNVSKSLKDSKHDMSKRPNRLTRISKELSRLLRHEPPPNSMDEQGYVEVPVLLQHMRSKPTWEELQEVVASCKKV
jgi:RNA:NAD 2'-phosphotransferase (TPT1/KptA family)